METQKFDFFSPKSSKFEFWLLTKSWNHLSFVNISPTLVIDTSIERSSRVLRHGNTKIWFFFKKIRNSNFDKELKSPQLRQYQSYISNWCINGKVFTSTTAWKPKNLIFFFKKIRNSNFDEELKSPQLRQYQSYISNWYINRMVFTSTTPWKPRNVKIWNEIEFCPYPEFPYAKKKNRPGFVNISPTLVIDMSTERSSRVLQHGNQKIWFFFFEKSSKLNSTCILTCAKELKSFK